MTKHGLTGRLKNGLLTRVLVGYIGLTGCVNASSTPTLNFNSLDENLNERIYLMNKYSSGLERKCTDGRVDVYGLALPEVEKASQASPEFKEAAVAVEEALAFVPNWVQELEPCAFDYVIFVDGANSFAPVGKKSKIVLDDKSYFFTFTDLKIGKVLPHVYVNVRPFTRILLPMLRDKDKRKDTLARISVYFAHELAERRGKNPYAAEIVQIGHLLNTGYINPNLAETMRAETIAAKDYWDKGPLRVVIPNRP